jgi:hypothetical protein
VAESCDGVGNNCPDDAFKPSTEVCRPSAGVCDLAEQCTGSAAACPADAKSTAECRGSLGECDPAEVCNGSSDGCPGDLRTPAEIACSPDSNECTIDQCDGSSPLCTHDEIRPDCGSESCTNGTNTPPTVEYPTGPPSDPQPKNTLIQITANYTDPSSNQTHTCSIDWDDEAPTAGVIIEPSGANPGTCSGTHVYTVPGVYTITVTVSDNCGSRQNKYEFVVIYDPNAGFVTGGGWINQPSDGFPELPGKASFGFVSKYKKGSSTPDGETEFQFKAGDINFHSTSYDAGSLVISGGKKATYRGDGTVNGEFGYRFVLIAVDGDASNPKGPDRFRIKISKTGVGVIYDNEPGSSEDPDLSDTTILGGGSIVIHK